jgi:serine/threonine protein phosphatase PrpC
MLEAFGLSDPGRVRLNNEDCYLISPKDRVYMVADGMGGAQAGEHASKLAVETVAAVIKNAPAPDAETLFQAFREANLRVMNAAASDPQLEGMGTTLVAALESGPELLIASVGDSRAYTFNGGDLTGITEDQTWVNEVGRRLGIEEASLKSHPMRHVLTMAIGVSPELRVHSYTVRPLPGELILLSSDGLHGVVEQGVIADALSGNGSLQAKCERLIDAAKQAGGPDNITVVLLRAP